jgi:guanosine-3',5'-bis(diphosphate) 3'-pyrophosphohydrolase
MKEKPEALLLGCLQFAAEKHRRQKRKDRRGSPYINHPIMVAYTLCNVCRILDAEVLAAAILHDTIEDTDTSAEEIEALFGGRVRRLVEEVTDDKRLPRQVRKRRQIETAGSKSTGAKLIQIADKISNITDLTHNSPLGWSRKMKESYLVWAHRVVDRLRGTDPCLEKLFDERLATAWARWSRASNKAIR